MNLNIHGLKKITYFLGDDDQMPKVSIDMAKEVNNKKD